MIAAAGNDGLEPAQYPAAYPDVLAVSATSASGTFAPQGDVDWWYLDAPAGGLQFHVETSWTDPYAERSSPDVQVFGSDLRPLTERLTGSTSVYAEVELALARRVYLRVANMWGSRGRLSNAAARAHLDERERQSCAPAAGVEYRAGPRDGGDDLRDSERRHRLEGTGSGADGAAGLRGLVPARRVSEPFTPRGPAPRDPPRVPCGARP